MELQEKNIRKNAIWTYNAQCWYAIMGLYCLMSWYEQPNIYDDLGSIFIAKPQKPRCAV